MPFKSEKQRRYMFANEPKIAKKWANEYNMGGVASMFRKKLEDGDLSPEIISQIESMAATGADASTISSLVGVSEEQVNNVLMSGSTSQMMPVEGEEMAETAEVTEEADPLLNLFSQNDSLNNDQALTTLFAEQEPQGIMAAANGGKAMKKIKGQDHLLAYITPSERDTLVNLGGQETMTSEGIPAYPPDNDAPGESTGNNSSNDNSNDNSNDYTGSDFGFVASQPTTTAEFNEGPTADGDALDMQDYLTDYVTVNEEKQKEKEYDDLPSAKKDMIKVKQDQAYKGRIKNVIKDIKDNPSIEKRIADKMVNYVVEKALLSNPYTAIAYGLAKMFGWKPSNSLVKTDISGNVIGKNTVTGSDLGFFQGDEYNDFWQGGPDEDEGGDVVNPITGEVNEDFATGNINYNMMSALDKIRANQARRSGLVESEIIQDNNQIMTANKGGLAGLFRVKNQ